MENDISGSVLTTPFAINELWLGSTTQANAALGTYGSGILTQSDFTLTVPGFVEVGEGFTDTTRDNVPGGTGILNLSGNAVFSHTTAGYFNIGEAATGAITTGTVNLSGNAILNNTFGRFIVGNGGSGIGYLNIGLNPGDNPTLNLGNEFHNIGYLGGTGTVNMNYGTVNNISGGRILAGGYQGTGTWYQYGGTINSTSNPLVLGDGAGSTGNFYLNGGVVNTVGVEAGIGWDPGNATGNFYFNGGELRAASASSSFMRAAVGSATNPGTLHVFVSAGGAKINTNGYNITITGTDISEDSSSPGGGLTKLGAGTLTLYNNSNTFTGDISVNAGTLLWNNYGWPVSSPTTTVASGATLGGTAIFQNVVVQAPVGTVRGALAPGNGKDFNYSSNTTWMGNLDITSAELKTFIHTPADSGLIDVSSGIVNVSISTGMKNIITLYQNLAVANETTAGKYILMKCAYL